MATTADRRLLRSREAAEILGLNVETLRRAVRAGSLVAVRLGPRGNLFFRADDVARLIGASEKEDQ